MTICADCQYLGDKYSFPLPNNLIDTDPNNPNVKHYYCCCGDCPLYKQDLTNVQVEVCVSFEGF